MYTTSYFARQNLIESRLPPGARSPQFSRCCNASAHSLHGPQRFWHDNASQSLQRGHTFCNEAEQEIYCVCLLLCVRMRRVYVQEVQESGGSVRTSACVPECQEVSVKKIISLATQKGNKFSVQSAQEAREDVGRRIPAQVAALRPFRLRRPETLCQAPAECSLKSVLAVLSLHPAGRYRSS